MNRERAQRLAIVVVVFGIVAGLVVFELGLRLVGFSYKSFPSVQFGWPDPKTMQRMYVADPDLLWVTSDYAETLREAHRNPPDVIFMGDSCTQFGDYPALTMKTLTPRVPSLARGVKVGFGGWTSQQGLWQLERDILQLHPKVVTLYYGWNDHWVAIGPQDKDARPNRLYFWLAQHTRLFQLVSMFRVGVQVRTEDLPNKRVDVEAYKANLEAMVRLIKENGAVPVLITAASNHVQGHEPSYLSKRWVSNVHELVPLHHAYVEATRQAARDTGAFLCDAFSILDPDPARDSLFEKDGIHPNKAGNVRVAEIVSNCIAQAVQPAAAQPAAPAAGAARP